MQTGPGQPGFFISRQLYPPSSIALTAVIAFSTRPDVFCVMLWLLAILLIILIVAGWLLLSPFVIEIDSSRAFACVRWKSIGRFIIWFNGEWYMRWQALFFSRQYRLSAILFSGKKKKIAATTTRRKRKTPGLKKIIRVIKTFRVLEWELALDTGDYLLNARLYPVNFLPGCYRHVEINFNEQNRLYMKIKNSPFRILLAWLK